MRDRHKVKRDRDSAVAIFVVVAVGLNRVQKTRIEHHEVTALRTTLCLRTLKANSLKKPKQYLGNLNLEILKMGDRPSTPWKSCVRCEGVDMKLVARP